MIKYICMHCYEDVRIAQSLFFFNQNKCTRFGFKRLFLNPANRVIGNLKTIWNERTVSIILKIILKLFWCVILTLFLVGPTCGEKMASDKVFHLRHEALKLLSRALFTPFCPIQRSHLRGKPMVSSVGEHQTKYSQVTSRKVTPCLKTFFPDNVHQVFTKPPKAESLH